jgi:hypothetical protein
MVGVFAGTYSAFPHERIALSFVLESTHRGVSMKRLSVVVALLAAFGVAGSALAVPALHPFGTGDVTVDGDDATIVNGAGEFGGVFLNSRSNSGKRLTAVDFSFTSTGDVTGGAPRFSIPIDTDDPGSGRDLFAFVDAQRCGGVSGTPVWVSTENPACIVDLNTGGFYANWDAFAAAHPDWRIAPGDVPFVIADQPGEYEVNDVQLR